MGPKSGTFMPIHPPGSHPAGSFPCFFQIERSPEVPRSDRGKGAPGGCQFLDRRRWREVVKFPFVLDRLADSEVGDRQDIHPAEAEDQEHLSGPDSDPPDGGQGFDDRIVRGPRQTFQIDRAAVDFAGEVEEVAGLLP